MSNILGDEAIWGSGERWRCVPMSESDFLDRRYYLVGVMCDDGSLIWQLCKWMRRHISDGTIVPGVFIGEGRWVELKQATLCRLLPEGYTKDGMLHFAPEVDNEQ